MWIDSLRELSSRLVTYLEKDEMEALLAAPDVGIAQGRRDHALLLFLYNTGARADEAAHVQITDPDLGQTPGHNCSAVLIHGKGNKLRRCPLWTRTVDELRPLIVNRDASQHAFLNRRGQPLTRFGIHALVERYATVVAARLQTQSRSVVTFHGNWDTPVWSPRSAMKMTPVRMTPTQSTVQPHFLADTLIRRKVSKQVPSAATCIQSFAPPRPGGSVPSRGVV